MEKIILIKYGELSTKKANINFFLKTLKDNVERSLKNEDVIVNYDKGRMFVSLNKDNFDLVVEKLKKVFGIHEIVIGYKIDDTDLNTIKEHLLILAKEKEFKTFKVETKRSDKTYHLNSMEISRSLGAHLLKNIEGLKVDVHNPELNINVELRKNACIIYFDRYEGFGGYPVGTLGKGLLMLSGGIDSPVAGYMAIKRGVKLEGIYFESPPHTSVAAKNKVMDLASKLAVYNNDFKLHVINFTEIQEAIFKNIPHEYLITIMRRMMYRISAIIAKNNRGHILVNGESIGQVASQTLTSMEVINSVVNIPVIRPVACFDKTEIIKLAKEIDTYETSILPFEDCCTIFVPEHPVINPEKIKCEEYEKLIPWEELIYKAIKNHEVIKVSDKKEEYNELL